MCVRACVILSIMITLEGVSERALAESTGAVKRNERSAKMWSRTCHWMSWRSKGSASNFLMACVSGGIKGRGQLGKGRGREVRRD